MRTPVVQVDDVEALIDPRNIDKEVDIPHLISVVEHLQPSLSAWHMLVHPTPGAYACASARAHTAAQAQIDARYDGVGMHVGAQRRTNQGGGGGGERIQRG